MTPEQRKALALAAARKRAADAQPKDTKTTDARGTEYVMNPETGQMTSRELLKNAVQPSRFDAVGSGYLSGYALSGADEIAGAVGGEFAREKTRARFEANREAFPGLSTAGEVAGIVGSPATWLAPATGTVRGAAATGMAFGAAEGALRGEGDRAEKAAQGAILGSFFGAGSGAVLKYGNKGLQALAKRNNKAPTIAGLKAEKNAAYKLVEDAGERFTGDEILNLAVQADDIAKARFYVPETDTQTRAALKTLENVAADDGLSLPQLDKVRQAFWERYAKESEPAILDMIGSIDDLISSKATASELMQGARQANARYSKAKVLDIAFKDARLRTAASNDGTGGLINRYKQAVLRILNNRKERRFFSQQELETMESFVMGDNAELTLRRMSKLSPNGNGLMTALNVYAAAVDPTMLAISATATAAKGATDRAAARSAQGLQDSISTGVIQAPQAGVNLAPAAIAGGVGVPAAIRGR